MVLEVFRIIEFLFYGFNDSDLVIKFIGGFIIRLLFFDCFFR